MRKFLKEVKVDFSTMTLEELKESREVIRAKISKVGLDDNKTLLDLKLDLSNVNHQILMRLLSGHKFSSNRC